MKKIILLISLFLFSDFLLSEKLLAQATMRLDYFHTGNASSETFSLDQLVIEPLAWPGNRYKPLDNLLRGKYLFEVVSDSDQKILYSRSFSSIYGEWETTEEAQKIKRTFHESIRFPKPDNNFSIVLKKRNQKNEFEFVWQSHYEIDDILVHREQANYQNNLLSIEKNGDPSNKVDLLILGDGYTKNEQKKFELKAKELSEYFLSSYPFNKRRKDFNVWALAPEAKQSGVSRPSTGRYIDSPLGATYDAFHSERYVLSFDNKSWRRVASSAPYDAVIILTNSETYGGGGIYGLYSTAAANSDWAEYLFVHEFGHHFAGLADEYFTSSVAYQPPQNIVEPYEPNVTALLNSKKLKWQHLVKKETALPTDWPKAIYEEHSLKYQKIRAQLRLENKPESAMNELFRNNQIFAEALFAQHKNNHVIGAFEGANYSSTGYYRSAMNCIMFTRTKDYCDVCAEAIEQMIDLLVK